MLNKKKLKITPENLILPKHEPNESVWEGISEALDVAAKTEITADNLPQYTANPALWNSIESQLPRRGLFFAGSYIFTFFFAFIIILLSQMNNPADIVATVQQPQQMNVKNSPKEPIQTIAFSSPEREKIIDKSTIDKKTTTAKGKTVDVASIKSKTIIPKKNSEKNTIVNDITQKGSKAQTISYSENTGSEIFQIPTLPFLSIAQKESPSSLSLQLSDAVNRPFNKKKTLHNGYLRAGVAQCFSAIKAFDQYKLHNGIEYAFMSGFRKQNMLFETGLLYTDITYEGMHVIDYYQYEYLGTVIHLETEESITITPSGDTVRRLRYNPVLKDIYDSVNISYDDELVNRIKYIQIPINVGQDFISQKKITLSGMAGIIWSIPVSQSAIELYNPDGLIKINENKITVPLQVRSRLMLNGEVIFRYHINRYIRPYASVGFRFGKTNTGYETLYPDSGELQGLLKVGLQIHF